MRDCPQLGPAGRARAHFPDFDGGESWAAGCDSPLPDDPNRCWVIGVFLVLVSGAHAGTTTYNCNNCPVPIVDLSTVNGTLQINDRCDEIGDINVSINISHTFDSDLNVDLIGPGPGPTVRLWDALGGAGDGFNVTIDDETPPPFTCALGPCVGTFQPEDFPVDALSLFDGTDAVGTWDSQGRGHGWGGCRNDQHLVDRARLRSRPR